MSNSSEAGMGFEKKGYMTRSFRSPDGRVLSFDCGRCGYESFGKEEAGCPRCDKPTFISPEAKADATVETEMVKSVEDYAKEAGNRIIDLVNSNIEKWHKPLREKINDAFIQFSPDDLKVDCVIPPTAISKSTYSMWRDAAIPLDPNAGMNAMRAMYEKCQNPDKGDKEFDASLERLCDPTRAAVELEMSEVMIRKYRELKQLVWRHAKGAMQRQYSAWPTCAEHGPKKLQAELFGGNIIPAFGCPCGVVFVKPYGAPVDLVRRAASLGNPQVVCGEQDGEK